MQAIFYFAICSRTYSVGAVEIREIKMSKFDGLKKKMCNNKPRVYWNPATVKKTVGFFLGGEGCKFVNKFVFKEDFFQRFDIYDPKGFMLIAFWRYREKRHLCSTRKQQMLFGKKISFKCKHVNLNERYLIPFFGYV